ncbi:MAG TPA: hypothetical protein VGL10_00620 [Gammaproteobacteria bacterium]
MFRKSNRKIRVIHFLKAVFFIAGMLCQAYACDKGPMNNNSLCDAKLVRQFVLYNYRQLANDVLNGDGIYLSGFYRILGVDYRHYDSTLFRVRELLLTTSRIPDFAIEVSNQYVSDCPQK